MVIKILGSGCKNCTNLAESTKIALKDAGMTADLVKVEDFQEIMKYGVMSTPALVIDEQVASYGKVLKPAEIEKILLKLKEK